MQEVKAKQTTRREQDEAVDETQADTARSAQVSEDAACCLADIDEALAECTVDARADLVESDEDIVNRGVPDYYAYEDDDQWEKAYQRFRQAYENFYGVSYNSCTC